MAININGFKLPDLPAGTLENYPYAAIVYATGTADNAFMFMASESELFAVTEDVIYGSDIMGDCWLMVTNITANVRVGEYIHGTSTGWENVTDATGNDAMVPLVYPAEYGMDIALCWSNCDVKIATGMNGDVFVAGNEVYPVTPDKVDIVTYEERYSVPSSWLLAVAMQARRLGEVSEKMEIDEILSVLENVEKEIVNETKTSWIADISTDFDFDNDTITYTYNGEEVWMPSGIELKFEYFDYDVIVEFSNIQTLKGEMFDENVNLKSFSAPLLTSITHGGFSGCSALEEVNIPSVTDLSYSGIFCDCTALASIDLPVVETIGGSCFARCSALRSINLPKAKTIGAGAFSACEALTKVDLGAVEQLKALAFSMTTNLQTLIIRTPTMCTLMSAADDKTEGYSSHFYPNTTVYVPRSLVDEYKANAAWIASGRTILAIEDYPDICG